MVLPELQAHRLNYGTHQGREVQPVRHPTEPCLRHLVNEIHLVERICHALLVGVIVEGSGGAAGRAVAVAKRKSRAHVERGERVYLPLYLEVASCAVASAHAVAGAVAE